MLNVILNLALFVAKFIGGKLSHSVSVTSDAFNNLTDAATTMFAWFGLRVSSIGSGKSHPNGHGRFEWVIALISSSSVILVGWELLRSSLDSIVNPEQTVFDIFTVAALVISVVVKFYMFIYNKKRSTEKNSSALKAVSVDCLSDSVSTAAVLASFVINEIFSINIDGWCGALVSLFIIYNGFSSFINTTERIMGKSASVEQLDELRAFALENTDFNEICDLQIEDYGYGRFRASMTVVGKESVHADRLLADTADLKYRIYEKYGYSVLIAVLPWNTPNKELYDYIQQTLSSMNVPLQLLSLHASNTGSYILAELELGIDFVDDRKKNDLEKELRYAFMHAPDKFRIIPKLQLKATNDHRNRHKKHHSN